MTWFALACGALAIGAATGRSRGRMGWSDGRGGRACRGALAAAMALAGAGWFALRINEAPPDSLGVLLTGGSASLREASAAGADGDGRDEAEAAPPSARTDRPLITIEAIALDNPRPAAVGGGSLGAYQLRRAGGGRPADRTLVSVCAVASPAGNVNASGRVWLVSPPTPRSGSGAVRAGVRLRATGRFTPIGPPLNPGQTDRRLWAAQESLEGRVGTLSLPSLDLLTTMDDAGTFSDRLAGLWAATITRLRAGAAGALNSALPESASSGGQGAARGVLRALLLGEYDPGAEAVTAAFTRQGLVHILAISGFHLVVMAGVVLFIVRLTGDRGWVEPAIVAALVSLYMLIVPAEAPVIRSGVMVLALLAAEASGRRYDRLAVVGWIAIALLIWRPMDLWSLGWQLSFGIVGVLLWAGRGFHHRLFPPGLRGLVRPPPPTGLAGVIHGAWRFLLGTVKELASTSLLCWLVAAPTIAYHTGAVSPLAALTSIIVVPLATLLLWLGYAALLIGAIVPPAARLVGWALTHLADTTAALVVWLDQWPLMAWRLPTVSIAWAVAATVAVLVIVRHGRVRDRRTWAIAAIVLAWLGAELFAVPRIALGGWRGVAGRVALRIDTLAVGEGTCHLLRSGTEAVLWDCGSRRTELGERDVPRAVRALGAWRVRTAVLSGSSVERLAGIVDAAEPLGIRRVLIGEALAEAAESMPASMERAALRGLRERGVEVRIVRAGDELTIGSATARFVWPWHRSPGGRDFDGTTDIDDRSLAAVVTVPTAAGDRVVLFTGDVGPEALDRLASAIPHADVLELPRRRGMDEAVASLILRTGPDVVLESAGPARHPGGGPLLALHADRRWLVTAIDGAAWVVLHRSGSIEDGSHLARPAPGP